MKTRRDKNIQTMDVLNSVNQVGIGIVRCKILRKANLDVIRANEILRDCHNKRLLVSRMVDGQKRFFITQQGRNQLINFRYGNQRI